MPRNNLFSPPCCSRSEKLENITGESVFLLIMTGNVFAVAIGLLTAIAQIAILKMYWHAIFAEGDEKILVTHFAQCPREDSAPICVPKNHATSWGMAGWISILSMTIVPEIFAGLQLIAQCKPLASLTGCLLLVVAYESTFVAMAYAGAVSQNSADVITNIVVVLFVHNLDEKVYSALKCCAPKWVELLVASFSKDVPVDLREVADTRPKRSCEESSA